MGMMSHADYSRAIDIPQVRGNDTAPGRVLTDEELSSLLRACEVDPSPAGIRDAAILGVMYGTGIRRSELAALRLADYADGVLKVRGKGNKSRLAYVVGEPRSLLERWMETRGTAEGGLFVPIVKSGRVGTRPISAESLHGILRARALEAGIPEFSPHDLRRTCATRLLEKGVDVFVVQRMMGHRWVTTTQVYDKRGEDAKIKAAVVLKLS